MQFHISGKHMAIGDSFHEHMTLALNALAKKHAVEPVEVTITVAKDSYQYIADVSLHLARGVIIRGHAVADQPYGCFDNALDHITQRLRRHKKRIRDIHQSQAPYEFSAAQSYVIQDFKDDHEESMGELQPIIVAETATRVPTLTVSEAVLQMDLAHVPIMMFRNKAHGRINAVYRRDDQNIGWIDPEEAS